MPAAPPAVVSAVFENGGLRFLSPPPFAEGEVVTVAAAPNEAAEANEDALPPLDPDDPLEKLSRLVIDGPPDGSTRIDEYKLGLKTWPPE